MILKYSFIKSNQATLIHSPGNAHSEAVSYNLRLIKINAKVKPTQQKLKQSPINNWHLYQESVIQHIASTMLSNVHSETVYI